MEEYEARLWLQRDLDLVQRKKRRASWGLFLMWRVISENSAGVMPLGHAERRLLQRDLER